MESRKIKSVMARHSTGSGIKSKFLVGKVQEIITALYVYGFIVNNVCGYCTTENRSCFRQLVTLTVRDIFTPSCKTYTVSTRELI